MPVRKVKSRNKTALMIDFRYVDDQGFSRRFRKVADVQTMAAARAEEMRLRMHASQHGAVYRQHAPCITLREFVDAYWRPWSTAQHKPSTRERYEYMLGQGILDAFGDVPLRDITADKVSAYAAQLTLRGVQPWPHTSLISSMLRAAVELGQLGELPRLPSQRRKKQKLPTCPDTADVDAMLAAATGWLRVAVAIAAYAGLRCGEVRALEVRDIDWAHNRILVRRALSADVVTTTKSDKERIVPIAPELAPILREATTRKRPADRVVTTADGKTPLRQNVLYRFTQMLRRHGLPHRSFHSLRHHFCTTLLRRGADVELVRVVAGHTQLATTLQYLHARADDAILFMGRHRADTRCEVLN